MTPTSDETFLDTLNIALRPTEHFFVQSFGAPRYPTIFIVGLPRSGTTLLTQLLTMHLDVGYISNVAARFWDAPYVGARLSRLVSGSRETLSALESVHGVTSSPFGPHEFGHFWNRWFKYGETHVIDDPELSQIDSDFLKRELAAVESVFDRSVTYKNLAACGMHITFLAHLLPNAVFLRSRRSSIEVAQSLLLVRRATFNNDETWWSVRPKEYLQLRSKSWDQQIAGQIYFIEERIRSQLSQLSSGRWMDVNFEDICTSPDRELTRIANFLTAVGGKFSWPQTPLAPLSRRSEERITVDEHRRLERALAYYAL